MKKIGLFGGTFDPIHKGHLQIASSSKNIAELDEVIFIPCQQSPHKQNQTEASATQRKEMIDLAISELPWASSSDYEILKTSPSFSYLTAEHFQQSLDPVELFWILGDDQWVNLHQWKEIALLKKRVTFIVHERNQERLERPDYKARFVHDTLHPASATQIRKQINEQQIPSWLNESVHQFITEEKLYLSD